MVWFLEYRRFLVQVMTGIPHYAILTHVQESQAEQRTDQPPSPPPQQDQAVEQSLLRDSVIPFPISHEDSITADSTVMQETQPQDLTGRMIYTHSQNKVLYRRTEPPATLHWQGGTTKEN